MALTYGEKEQAYRKRILMIAPIAAVLVGALFVTSDVVPYEDLRKNFGWEGPAQVVVNLTIVPDEAEIEQMKEVAMKTLAAMDVDVIDEIAEAEGGDNVAQEIPIEEPEPITQPELDEVKIRTYESHTDIPYSNDYVILHMVQPEYPTLEMIQGIEGNVTVELLVNEKGAVEDAWVLAAHGPKSFEDASLAAVRQFLFKPPTENGRPIPMWIRFDIRFRF